MSYLRQMGLIFYNMRFSILVLCRLIIGYKSFSVNHAKKRGKYYKKGKYYLPLIRCSN